jgi:hypothetical protein
MLLIRLWVDPSLYISRPLLSWKAFRPSSHLVPPRYRMSRFGKVESLSWSNDPPSPPARARMHPHHHHRVQPCSHARSPYTPTEKFPLLLSHKNEVTSATSLWAIMSESVVVTGHKLYKPSQRQGPSLVFPSSVCHILEEQENR